MNCASTNNARQPSCLSATHALTWREIATLDAISEANALQLEFAFWNARPFLKWVGGKGRLLSQLLPLLPAGVEHMRHVEPFLGGAAMFFARQPERALLCDVNAGLCATYEAVRDEVNLVIQQLRHLAKGHNSERYYQLRHRYNHTTNLSQAERAALFIYLNKTCFNGLHRVNRSDEFNVPAGRYAQPRIVDAPGLFAAQQSLQAAQLRCGSFETVLDAARSGDFVYLDSPYDVEKGAAGFTAYAVSPFGPAEQDLQAEVFRSLDRRGCKLMLSNSDTLANRTRYARFDVREVLAPRSVSCNGAQRQAVTELVVRNYA